jgi:hypothetical protein
VPLRWRARLSVCIRVAVFFRRCAALSPLACRVLLVELVKAVTNGGLANGKPFKFLKVHKPPKNLFQQLANIQQALDFLKEQHGVAKGGQLVNIRAAAIAAGDKKQTLALIWVLIGVQASSAAGGDRKTKEEENEEEKAKQRDGLDATSPAPVAGAPAAQAAGAAALLHWCKGIVKPYTSKGLCGDVKSFAKSFADGRLFAALIDAHLPQAIDPTSLGSDAKRNLAQVMQVASFHPALRINPMSPQAQQLMLTTPDAGKLVTVYVPISTLPPPPRP